MVEATQLDDGGKVGQILNAARGVFLEQGYANASMDMVAKHAGVSKATIYAHFESKDALFTAMVQRARRSLADSVRHIATTPDIDAVEALRLAGRQFLRFVTDPAALTLFRAVIGETQRFPQLGNVVFNAGRNETLDLFTDAFQRCDAAGTMRVADPREAAKQYLSLIKSDTHMGCLLDPRQTLSEEQIVLNVDKALAVLQSHYRPER